MAPPSLGNGPAEVARGVPAALTAARFSFLRRVIIEPAAVVAFGVAASDRHGERDGSLGPGDRQYAWREPSSALLGAGAGLNLARGWSRSHVARAGRIRPARARRDRDPPNRRPGGHRDSDASSALPSLGQFRYAYRWLDAVLRSSRRRLLRSLPGLCAHSANRERFERAFMRSLRWVCVGAFPSGCCCSRSASRQRSSSSGKPGARRDRPRWPCASIRAHRLSAPSRRKR